MADPRLGIAFQAERLALIQEIARNLVGETLPATGASSVKPASVIDQSAVAGTDDTPLADRLAIPAGTRLGVAALLVGMKAPLATLAQPDAYSQALAQLAKSEPVLAAIFQNAGRPDAPAAAGTATPPPKEAAAGIATPIPEEGAVGMATASPEAGGETDLAFVEAAERPPVQSKTTESGTEIRPALGMRREAVALAGAEIATAAAAEAGSTDAPVPDALASTQAVVERAVTALGLGEGAVSPSAMRAEVGGIIASFILNAHFLPGWPPLRPVQDPEAKAFVTQLAKDPKLSKDDIAALTYLANFGLNRTQLARILKLLANAATRSGLLEFIAQLLANISALLGAVHSEIEALAEEIMEARTEGARRERLTLR